MRSPFRRLAGPLLLLAPLALVAVEAQPPPPDEETSGAEGATVEVLPYATLALPDLVRSRDRWATTPYATLLATPWGQDLAGKLEEAITDEDPVYWRAALQATMARGAMGFGFQEETSEPLPALTGQLRTPQATTLALTIAATEAGTFTLDPEADNRWTTAEGIEMAVVDGSLAISNPLGRELDLPELAAAADAHLELDYSPLVRLAAASPGLDPALFEAMAAMRLTMAVHLEPNGLREQLTMPLPEDEPLWNQPMPVADRALLDNLPADTLWAATFPSDPEFTAAWLQDERFAQAYEMPPWSEIGDELAARELPTIPELATALDGHHLIYAQESAPWPAFTVAVAVERELAERVIAELAAELGLAAAGEDHAGMVGMVHIALGHHDGRLVATSHPQGLAAHREREGGFTDLPAIQAALARMPEGELFMLGASRSSDWWGTLGGLSAVFLNQTGIDGIVALGSDLRETDSHGFLAVHHREDGVVEMTSGGLAGGLMTQSMLLPGAMAGMWFYQMQQAMRGIGAEPLPPPVEVQPAP